MDTSKHILIVEDLPLSQEIVRSVLQAAGHSIDIAGNGAEAVEAVRCRRYDLVLMDLDMPVMDGYAASAAIGALPVAARRVPVVALSAKTGTGEAERCRQAGMDDYCAKPFRPAELLREIERWARIAPAPSATAVWDRSTYRELADRLGSGRMQTALAMFEAHLVRSLGAIRAAPQDDAVLHREAHGLVSIAGMLGFSELSAVSRRMMIAEPSTASTPSLRDGLPKDRILGELDEAAERVFARLRTEAQAALA